MIRFRCFVRRWVGLLLFLTVPGVLPAAPPKTKSPAPSRISITEASADRILTEWVSEKEADDEEVDPTPAYRVAATGKLAVTASLVLTAEGLAAIGPDTVFEMTTGGHFIRRTLSEDPNYKTGAKKARFDQIEQDPYNPKIQHRRTLQLAWSAKGLSVKYTATTGDLESSPWGLVLAAPRRDEPPAKSILETTACQIAFGRASAVFDLGAKGSATLKAARAKDGSTFTLSAVKFAAKGTSSTAIPRPPVLQRVAANNVGEAGVTETGAWLSVGVGEFSGTTVSVPAGLLPAGTSLSFEETDLQLAGSAGGAAIKGFRLSAASEPATGFIEVDVPGCITGTSIRFPYAIAADGSLAPCEITAADPDRGSFTIRLPVGAEDTGWTVQSRSQAAGDPAAPKALAAAASDWSTEVGFLDTVYNWDGPFEESPWWQNGGEGWAAWRAQQLGGLGDFFSGSPEEDPVDEPARQAADDYNQDQEIPLPAVQLGGWDDKRNSLLEEQAAMIREESSEQRYQKLTGFLPGTHGFAVPSGATRYLRDTSVGMASFALWNYENHKGGAPLKGSYRYKTLAGDGTGQDILASRATATLDGKSYISLSKPLGLWMRYATTQGYLWSGSPVLLRASRFDSSGNMDGVRYLVAFGIEQTAGLGHPFRIMVYDPEQPGVGRRVRYHSRYGMFYEFKDGALGLDIRPVIGGLDAKRRGQESFSRIKALAEAQRLDGTSQLEELSIEQDELVTAAGQTIRCYLQDGGELPVRMISVTHRAGGVVQGTKESLIQVTAPYAEMPITRTLLPGANEISYETFGTLGPSWIPLDHDKSLGNSRRIYYMGMPLTLTKLEGDNQVVEGPETLPVPLKIQVTDANGLPVPYPMLNWKINDPAAYGGGLLSSTDGAYSGTSLSLTWPDPEGLADMNWKLGSLKESPQYVTVELNGVKRYLADEGTFVTASIPLSTAGKAVFSAEVGAGMVLIPGGAFQMGDNLDSSPDAPPVTVNISAFYMAKHETTKARWDAVRSWGLSNGYTDLRSGFGKAADHPVSSIDWLDMVKWCNARSEMEGLTPCYTVSGAVLRTGTNTPACNWAANGYRLPTEAEWEKAARGGVSGKRFPWGTDAISHSKANYYASTNYSYDLSGTVTNGFHPTYATGSSTYSSPVGSFAANPYGLYDMAGNVYEWCWDWYNSSTYVNGATDPRGAASGSVRVFRGGSWLNDAAYCRVARRVSRNPPDANHSGGFRVARSSVR